MLQAISNFIENLVASESFKALVCQIGTTQSDNQDIKELFVELKSLILEIQKKCRNLLNNQEVGSLEQAKLSDSQNIEPIVVFEESQQSDIQSKQQLFLKKISISEKMNKNQQEIIANQEEIIMIKEKIIQNQEKRILILQFKLNLLSAQSNEQKESLYEIINLEENQQYLQQIVSSNQSIQMIEPLKQFKLIPKKDIDPMFDKLQNCFLKIQEDSELVCVKSKEALKLPFYNEKKQEESLLINLQKLLALSNECIKKYGEWLAKSREKDLNGKCEEQILVQIQTISIYNQKIMQTLSKLIEQLIKSVQQILEKYNLIAEQHQQQQKILKADDSSRLLAQNTKIQLEPLSTQFNLKEDKKIKFITANGQFIKEFQNLSIQFAIEQLNTLSQSIYKEAKKICPVSKELWPEVFMSKIQSPYYSTASQLYQLGFDHMQNHKHLFSKQHNFLFQTIFEHYQFNMKHSLRYFQEQLNLLQKQQGNLAKILFNSKDEQIIKS